MALSPRQPCDSRSKSEPNCCNQAIALINPGGETGKRSTSAMAISQQLQYSAQDRRFCYGVISQIVPQSLAPPEIPCAVKIAGRIEGYATRVAPSSPLVK